MHVCELRTCQCGTMASAAARLTPSSRPSFLPPPPADWPPGDGRRHAFPGQHHLALGPAGLQQAPCQHQVRDHHILRPEIPSAAPLQPPTPTPRTFLFPCIQVFIYSSLTHIHASPVPSHCDGKASLGAAYSCTPPLTCPATHTDLFTHHDKHSCGSPVPPQHPWQPLSPVAAAANGGALERMILDWCHFTVALLSQPNCLFLLILLFLTTCICLQILLVPRGCVFILLLLFQTFFCF